MDYFLCYIAGVVTMVVYYRNHVRMTIGLTKKIMKLDKEKRELIEKYRQKVLDKPLP